MADSVTAIILLFLAGFFLWRAAPGTIGALRARRWRSVEGTITGSGTQGYHGAAGGGHGRTQFTRAAVAYTYAVDGQTYTGSRITFGAPLGFGSGLQGIAAAQVAKYAPGSAVTVWADPADPAQSVLQRTPPSSLAMLALGLGLAVVGAIALQS